eukprot:Hpha_TRINITY_DN15743_c1_g5::TRINITY_DN15743_c1_g5_i1::g.40073::m.40073
MTESELPARQQSNVEDLQVRQTTSTLSRSLSRRGSTRFTGGRRRLGEGELRDLRRMRRYLPERKPIDADTPDLSPEQVWDQALQLAESQGVLSDFFTAAVDALGETNEIRVLCCALKAVGFDTDPAREPRITPHTVACAAALAWECGPRKGVEEASSEKRAVRLRLRLEARMVRSMGAQELLKHRLSVRVPEQVVSEGGSELESENGEVDEPQQRLMSTISARRSMFQSAFGPAGHMPKVHLAAMYVQDALEFQPLRQYRETPHAMRSHRKRLMLYYIIWADILGLLALSFISEPLWCKGDAGKDGACDRKDQYLRWNVDVISRQAALWWESLGLAVLSYDYFLWVSVLGWEEVRKWKWRVFHGCVLFASVIDVLVAFGTPNSSFRLGVYLRLLFWVAYSVQMQRQFNFLIRTVPEFAKLLALLSAYVLCAAWFAVVFFPNNEGEGEKYFHELGEAMFNLMDLLTTNNFPDVMMPAYTANRWNVLFFACYVFIGLWLFVNLFIALVNQAFHDSAESERGDMLRNQNECITKAYRLLAGDQGAIDRNLMLAVFAELNNNSRTRYIPTTEANILFGLLDNSGDCEISLDEFRYLPFMLYLEFDETSQRNEGWLSMHLHFLRNTGWWSPLCKIVRSPRFDALVDVVLVLNAVLVVVETRKYLLGEPPSPSDETSERGWQGGLDFMFSVLYLLEMLLKIAVDGWNYYWGQLRNMFDAVVTLLVLFSCIYILVPNGYNNTEMLRWFVMLRLCRVVRLIGGIPHFEVIFGTLVHILPDVKKVVMLLFCIMYLFTCLGCDLFGGKINKDPNSPHYQALVGLNTTYDANDWYALNFNDMGSGMVMLFGCLVMNNWDNYVAGYVAVTSKWARVFFVAFWVVGYITCFNIMISAILGKFSEHSRTWKRKGEFDHDAQSGWLVSAPPKAEGASATFGVILKETGEGLVIVENLDDEGPAAKAGVRLNSVLATIRGRRVRSMAEADMLVRERADGEENVEGLFEVEVHIGEDGWGHFNAQRITQTYTGEDQNREFRVRFAGDEALLRYAAEERPGGMMATTEGAMDAEGFIQHLFSPHDPSSPRRSPPRQHVQVGGERRSASPPVARPSST